MRIKTSNLISDYLFEATLEKDAIINHVKNFLKRHKYHDYVRRAIVYQQSRFDRGSLDPGVGFTLSQQIPDSLVRKLRSSLKGTGWSVSSHYEDPMNDYKEEDEEKIYLLDLVMDLKAKKPKYLYHATPIENKDGILKNGLSPKSRGQFSGHLYDGRVFFTDRYDVRGLRDLIDEIYGKTDIAIFKLDTSKFKKFNLYHDDATLLLDAYYTKTHIPAKYLELVYEGDENDEGYDY